MLSDSVDNSVHLSFSLPPSAVSLSHMYTVTEKLIINTSLVGGYRASVTQPSYLHLASSSYFCLCLSLSSSMYI